MPVTFETPSPVAPGITPGFGAAEAYMQYLPTQARMQEATAQLASRQSAAQNEQALMSQQSARQASSQQAAQAYGLQQQAAQAQNQQQLQNQRIQAEMQMQSNQISQAEKMQYQRLQQGESWIQSKIADGTYQPNDPYVLDAQAHIHGLMSPTEQKMAAAKVQEIQAQTEAAVQHGHMMAAQGKALDLTMNNGQEAMSWTDPQGNEHHFKQVWNGRGFNLVDLDKNTAKAAAPGKDETSVQDNDFRKAHAEIQKEFDARVKQEGPGALKPEDEDGFIRSRLQARGFAGSWGEHKQQQNQQQEQAFWMKKGFQPIPSMASVPNGGTQLTTALKNARQAGDLQGYNDLLRAAGIAGSTTRTPADDADYNTTTQKYAKYFPPKQTTTPPGIRPPTAAPNVPGANPGGPPKRVYDPLTGSKLPEEPEQSWLPNATAQPEGWKPPALPVAGQGGKQPVPGRPSSGIEVPGKKDGEVRYDRKAGVYRVWDARYGEWK